MVLYVRRRVSTLRRRDMTPYESEELTTIIEEEGKEFVVLRSPETAEHDPDYRELGRFPSRAKALEFFFDGRVSNRHSGMVRRTRPGISNSGFALRAPRNDGANRSDDRLPPCVIRNVHYPTGKGRCRDLLALSSPLCKNISVFPKRKSLYMICHPVPVRGASAIVTDVGRDAVDAAASGAQAIAGRDEPRERCAARRRTAP